MLTIVSAKNPVYMSADHSSIHLDVIFAEFPNQILPFIANENDSYDHGVDLFNNAKNGKYGDVGEYKQPTLPNTTQIYNRI